MDEDDVAVWLEIPRTSVSMIFMGDDEGTKQVPIAVVFEEKLADVIADFLADRFPQPEGTSIGVKLMAVHPDLVEKWARGER